MTREEILRSMECVLESDKRTIKNPISEYGWLFDKIYEWKKSLEQEPKTGQWVKIKPYPLQMHDYECSKCGHETDDNTENYCSNCGAKMESEE